MEVFILFVDFFDGAIEVPPGFIIGEFSAHRIRQPDFELFGEIEVALRLCIAIVPITFEHDFSILIFYNSMKVI